MIAVALFVLLTVTTLAFVYILMLRRKRLELRRNTLESAASILDGEIRQSVRENGRMAISFAYEQRRFTLYEETTIRQSMSVKRCVIEAESASYDGEPIDFGTHEKSDLADDECRSLNNSQSLTDKFGQAFRIEFIDDEARHVLDMALDRRCARILLNKRGCWYECDGFSENAEMLAAGARTGAAALSVLLDALSRSRQS